MLASSRRSSVHVRTRQRRRKSVRTKRDRRSCGRNVRKSTGRALLSSGMQRQQKRYVCTSGTWRTRASCSAWRRIAASGRWSRWRPSSARSNRLIRLRKITRFNCSLRSGWRVMRTRAWSGSVSSARRSGAAIYWKRCDVKRSPSCVPPVSQKSMSLAYATSTSMLYYASSDWVFVLESLEWKERSENEYG